MGRVRLSMNEVVLETDIKSKIYTVRDVQVMLDSDLAKLYEVESKRLNEQVKRNIARFPQQFRFQLTEEEYQNLRSQNVTLNHGGRRYLPYVFTEQGVFMLSAILKWLTFSKLDIGSFDILGRLR